jgi:hypothetical protein
MLDQKSSAPRRPVDALFGESGALNAPNFVVEPAQPATTVTPPALDLFPEPVTASARQVSEPEIPAEPAPIFSDETIEPAFTLPTPEPSERTAESFDTDLHDHPLMPDFAAPPRASDQSLFDAPRSDERLISDIAYKIERLYDDIKMDLPDSPSVAAECMALLKRAREAQVRRDVATAEFLTQTVDARLKRSVKSLRAARGPILIGLWAWEIFMLALFGGLLAITFVKDLTLFGLPVAGELLALLRAIAWGGIGGMLGAGISLVRFIQQRDYDPAFNMHYLVRPLFGALIGAVLFLIAQAFAFTGIVASATAKPGDLAAGSVVLYLVAVFVGYKQEYILEFFDGILRALFRKNRAVGEE